MAGRLSAQQVTHFQDQGYLLFDQPVFKPAKFAALQTYFEGLFQDWVAAGNSPEHMDTPHFNHPKLFDWLFDDDVLDIVESIIGPDIALWSSHFICKPPRKGKRVPWHEDSAYWKDRLDPMEVVTIWLAVDPSTPENGCMQLIPGTHRHGFSNYHSVENPGEQVFSTEINASEFDVSQAVDCILKPNHCSLHHGKIIHGSNANQGTMRRCGYTMRYMPTSVKFLTGSDTNEAFQIYLARGKDKAGNVYGDPTKPNAKWNDPYANKLPAGAH